MSTLLGNSNIWLEKWNKERKKEKIYIIWQYM